MDKTINRPETILKLNAFRIHENEYALSSEEKKQELKKIDHMIEVVKNKSMTDEKIISCINFYGFASSDMPKYNEE